MTDFHKQNSVSKIAVIGNYLPRKCGIATFTTDICNALNDDLKSNGEIAAIVMNDIVEGYSYPDMELYILHVATYLHHQLNF